MLDLRLRSKVSAEELEAKQGKILGAVDYNVLLTGPTRVRKPDGKPLCVYLPGALREQVDDKEVYDILHSLRSLVSSNRGLASGTPRFKGNQRTYAKNVASAIVGAVDPQGQQKYCRLTAWTGRNLPEWQKLHPLLRAVADQLAVHVPDRYAAQQAYADKSDPAWIVPGTPFTTITINNTYPTGVHTDKGDLDEGFSSIACLRKGTYTGGQLVFAEYRVAVDLQHGDLILMDAHEWHGNVAITCRCGFELSGCCEDCGAERVSLVSYFRTKVARCGTPDEEYRKGSNYREQVAARRSAPAEAEK
ncbi:hypothetical protein [Microbispora sp. NPDC049125]|uniref:hypothetical protein n=1 Tax=Microbispora sp. NPDC049125 TaxID=3154929 RepID=UPI00346720E0